VHVTSHEKSAQLLHWSRVLRQFVSASHAVRSAQQPFLVHDVQASSPAVAGQVPPLPAPVVAFKHVEQFVLKQVLRSVAPGSGVFWRQVWIHAWLLHTFAHVAKAWHAVVVQEACCVPQLVFRHVWQPGLETGLPPLPPEDDEPDEHPKTAAAAAAVQPAANRVHEFIENASPTVSAEFRTVTTVPRSPLYRHEEPRRRSLGAQTRRSSDSDSDRSARARLLPTMCSRGDPARAGNGS
jgi:hypothetical protein